MPLVPRRAVTASKPNPRPSKRPVSFRTGVLLGSDGKKPRFELRHSLREDFPNDPANVPVHWNVIMLRCGARSLREKVTHFVGMQRVRERVRTSVLREMGAR